MYDVIYNMYDLLTEADLEGWQNFYWKALLSTQS